MSNDVTHGDNDLSLDLEDVSADDPSMDDAERSDNSDVSTELDLSFEDQDAEKVDLKEKAADDHAKSWAARIVSGKATYEDIPANHQYLLPKVRALLGQKEEVKPKKSDADPRAMLRFELKKDKLQNLDLEPKQVKTLNDKFKYYLGKGFAPDEALNEAIEFAGVDFKAVRAIQAQIKTGDAVKSSKPKYEGTEDPNKMSLKELAEYNAHNRSIGR